MEKVGGLAIAFNANEYALPYATMSLASTSLSDLTEIFKTRQKGKRIAAEKVVKKKGKGGGVGDTSHFH